MQTAEIRRRWLQFFSERGHTVVPSASLVSDDPSLLFNIAGMVPFIPYLTGRETPPYTRATSVQKCVRTLDIDEVGKTTRHGTFFQMNGNFSFGDYFKAGAIEYAWQFLTTPTSGGGLGFDPDRLWVTVYLDDDEAAELWKKTAGLPDERIQRRGMDDNYWDTGQPGPAGPCSEIYYDRGPEYGLEGGPIADEDRYIEIWNLVFMQYQRGEGRGKDYPILGELANKNIDTGMGMERVAFLLQGVENMYEIDEVRPVLDRAAELAGVEYGGRESHDDDVRLRVVADHVRSAMMLISDGVTPSNEGRGYVLRRLLRRAIRAMRLLGVHGESLPELLPRSRDAMKASYPEVETDFERISRIAYAEERAFLRTLASGTTLLSQEVDKVKGAGGRLSGRQAFTLHDTYGFPIDLTIEMASEQGVTVDEESFRALMAEQRDRAQADARAKKTGGVTDTTAYRELRDAGETRFIGYEKLQSDSRVRGIVKNGHSAPVALPGDQVDIVLEETPFYAESGGQRADTGSISGDGFTAKVLDVQRPIGGLIVHRVEVTDGELQPGGTVLASVDDDYRLGACQAHSATHLVHAALRELLGPGAVQAGSFNEAGYMRFDFSYNAQVSQSARAEIEEAANMAVRRDLAVSAEYMSLDAARASGAMALFGEKYGETVRVVDIGGPWSRELCAGTHVAHSSQVGPISVLSESSIGSGVRRIEASVGMEAFRHLAAERALVSSLSDILKVPAADMPGRVHNILERLKKAERSIDEMRKKQALAGAGSLIESARDIDGTAFVATDLGDVGSVDELRSLATDLRARLGERSGVVAVAGVTKGRPVLVTATTASARERGLDAGALVRTASGVLGGGGGGKKDLAQGGGTDASAVPAALQAVADGLSANTAGA
ncbi:alanine--tRNA ligase [Spelaeicoccus albus]|uniref:Alanine--tRNA ligase n=1 Tax=Spelaeicoccus albus TaxID=1280376 RepID=A0A7Z0D4A6_9MICO|nr:alanine--tRNA ligase [Spelaeicoccus albus]NYI68622.1 alanyl-tRNA synthetase [Spelaeicoccus albus]